MGKTLVVKGIHIGEGRPKLCVPITARNLHDLSEELIQLKNIKFDIIEWRIDYFEQLLNSEELIKALKMISGSFPNHPLLVTLRTAAEGGELEISNDHYFSIYMQMMETNLVDLIDVQLDLGDDFVRHLIARARSYGVYVIISHHNFQETKPKGELLQILQKGQELNGDIIKLAVMPKNMIDVLILLETTFEMYNKYADRPIVTMAMGSLGMITRIAGEWFGSALTFGSLMEASAPGQLPAQQLQEILTILHTNQQHLN